MSDLKEFWAEQKKDPEFQAYCDEMQPFADISKGLIAYRAENNLSQKELASLLGLTQADVSRLESCKGNPSLKYLNRIACKLRKRLHIEFQ